jgi:amino acid adenylation domain-containing protein
VHDDFFALGGHSLLATRLASRLRTAFGVQLPLRRLFETPTIAGLAGWVEGEIGTAGMAPRLVPLARTGEALPLSFAQQRLWFLYQLDPATTAYNMPLVLRLSGPVEPALLAAALGAVVERHEALRTVFQAPAAQQGVQRNEEPAQVVLPPAPFPLPLADLSSLPAMAGADEMRRRIDFEVARPFDLEHGPVLRGLLLRLAPHDQVLVLTLHHIAGDAWSIRVLMREMTTLCLAASVGRPALLPELPVQYADYAVWQRSWLEGEVLAEQLAYWRNQLIGAPVRLELPMERPRPEVQTVAGATEFWSFDDELSAGLHGLARREGVTPFMVLLAGFTALLGRYSGQTDVVVGSPIAGRNRQELEGLIGVFLNTLALRTSLAGDPSFHDLLGRVRETTLGAYTHQDIPFEQLLEELRPERSLAHTPLFQVMINWDNSGEAGHPAPVVLPELSLEVLTAGESVAKFDLELYARELGGRLELQLVYNRDLFGREAMTALLGHLATLLAGVVAAPERHLSELALTPEMARQMMGEPPAATEESLAARFSRVAAEHPDLPAVWTPEGAWTYRDLQARAAGVAHALLALDDPVDERVALLFTPGAPMVAAVLGTLMAGKTYVPLDPSYPGERLLAILADSGASALLAGFDLGPEVRDLLGPLPLLTFDALPSAPAGWEPPPVPAAAIAYLLYTSGSTGEPKGVVQSHGNVLHHVGTYAARLGIGPGDRLTLLPSYGFDASVMDLFGGLLHGAEICPWDVKARGAEGLAAWMAERGITVYHSTPTFFRYFSDSLAETEALQSLRWVVLGGEGVRPRDLELFQRLCAPGCRLVNGLGPTESTLALQAFYDQASQVDRSTLPVGLPVESTEVVLWNGAGRQVADWGVGEILIRGPHLAHGYWRRPELTAAAFGPDPEGGPGRVYRTGDLGRLLPGGVIEFAGRRDFQVKVRGIRVEPAEIEAALARHPGVQENAVLAIEDAPGETRLVAYVAAREGEPLTTAGLRAFLGERLPAPLVPAAFVFLPALPWTPTGKLDRRALPAPAARLEGKRAHVAPRDEVEKTLAAVWSELLKVPEESISVHDNFFDLGGHSLLITRVLSRVQAAFGVMPALRDLFADPTIAGIAETIARERQSAAPSSGMKLSAVPRRERQFRREDLDRRS